MKNTLKRMWRSGLSLMLAICMIVSLCSPAFATRVDELGKETINYVSLGDSMTNGYGLTNYDNNGYRNYGKEAYPNQFADWLEDTYGVTVNHMEMAMSAMRAEDLHFILEFPVGDEEAIAIADASWDSSNYSSDVEW